jgi:hypothetical protein
VAGKDWRADWWCWPQVPGHCMWDVVGEFITCPDVAYTQHFTTPFDEQCRNYW